MFLHSVLFFVSLALCYGFVLSHDEFDFVFTPAAKLAPRALLTTQHGEVIEKIATDQFTFCTYAFIVDHPESKIINIVSYSSTKTEQHNEILLGINYGRNNSFLMINGEKMLFGVRPPKDQWMHICLTWSNKEGTAEMYIDGRNRSVVTNLKKHYSIRKKGHLILGQGQDGGIQPKHGVRGRLTQFHFWNKILTEDEVKQAQNCRIHGNVVNWLNSTWKFFDAAEMTPSSSPCSGESPCLEKLSETVGSARCQHPTISKMDKKEFTPIDATQATMQQEPVYLPNSDHMNKLSWCTWFYYESQLAETLTPVAYYRDGTGKRIISFSVEGNFLLLDVDSLSYVSVWGMASDKWQHVCITWSADDKFLGSKDHIYLYMNGKVASNSAFENGGDYFSGGEIHYFHSQYDAFDLQNPKKGFALKVTGIDVWDSVLTPDQVLETFKCREMLRGNVLAWNGTHLEN